MTRSRMFWLASCSLLCACGVKLDRQEDAQKDNPPACRGPTSASVQVGTCRIRILSPRSCEVVDVSGGKTFRAEWTTDGTYCQSPYTIFAAGTPYSEFPPRNVVSAQVGLSDEITHYGGKKLVRAEDFSSLSSTDGTFEFTVADPDGAKPASVVFRLKR